MEGVACPEKPGNLSERSIKIAGKGIIFLFSASTVGKVLACICTIILTRFLGVEHFGLYSLGLDIIGISVVIAIFGMNTGVVKFVAQYMGEKKYAEVKGVLLITVLGPGLLGFGIGAALFFFAEPLARVLFDMPQLASVLRILAFVLPFLALKQLFSSALRGLQAMGLKAILEVFLAASAVILVAVLLAFGMRLRGGLLAFILSAFMTMLLGGVFILRAFPQFLKVKATVPLMKVIKFILPVFAISVLTILNKKINSLLVGSLLTARDVGLYNVAMRVALFVSFGLPVFNTVFSPMIADFHNRGRRKELENMFKLITRWSFTVAFPFFLLCLALSHDILQVFGRDFTAAVIPLAILAFAELVRVATGSSIIMLIMIGHERLGLINQICLLSASVILAYMLIPLLGIGGAAITYACLIGGLKLLSLAEIYFFEKIHPYNLKYGKPLFAGGLATGFLVVSNWLLLPLDLSSRLLINVISFGIVYVVALYLLGAEDEDEIVLRHIRTKVVNIAAVFRTT